MEYSHPNIQESGHLWIFILWIGLEWNGMEWNGMEWNGTEWNGMERNGMDVCMYVIVYTSIYIYICVHIYWKLITRAIGTLWCHQT